MVDGSQECSVALEGVQDGNCCFLLLPFVLFLMLLVYSVAIFGESVSLIRMRAGRK
jgi:hypothetical protein